MWYYVEDGQQRGPVAEAELSSLRASGKLNEETLVWREGMPNWQPLRVASPALFAIPAPVTDEASAPAPGLRLSADNAQCVACGGTFPASEVARFGSAAVCAACKPAYVQKLKEGAATPTGAMVYADFGTRFAAYFVDGLITGVIGMVIGGVMGGIMGVAGLASSSSGMIIIQVVSGLVGFIIRGAYFIYYIGSTGQTPGKKLCKIKVVNPDGSQVSYGQATGRFFGYILSSLICAIGFLMAAWDPDKRALHDRLCNTRVIKA